MMRLPSAYPAVVVATLCTPVLLMDLNQTIIRCTVPLSTFSLYKNVFSSLRVVGTSWAKLLMPKDFVLLKVAYCTLTSFIWLSTAAEPRQMECGNGIVEGDEECDCGSNDTETCRRADPCCVPGNCTLIEGAVCRSVDCWRCIIVYQHDYSPISPNASVCCEADCTFASGKPCFTGDQCTKSQDCTYP